MATDLSTPSNTLAKVRWREQYVSEGINKKLNGVVPHGVVRGGKLISSGIAMNVTIEDDSETGDSIYSYIDANGHQITFRQAGNVTLDLTSVASKTVFIGLEVTYVVSSDTVVKWRAFNQAEIDADPTLVVIGMVVVPASGLIAAASITDQGRRTAWQSISQYMRDAKQVAENGAFELVGRGLGASGDNPCPGWDYSNISVGGSPLYSFINGSSPQVGDTHLEIEWVGNGSQLFTMLHKNITQCRGGETVTVKFWLKGSGLTPGPGGSGHMGIRVEASDESPNNVIQTEYIEDLTLSGTWAYTEIERTFQLDADARWFGFAIYYDDNNKSSSGSIYFDDIRVWIEQPQVSEGQIEGYGPLNHGDIVARGLGIAKPWSVASTIQEFVENILSFRNDGSTDTYKLSKGDESLDFLLRLVNGGLDVENLISNLGSSKIGSDAEGALPRIKTAFPIYTTAKYVQLWEMENLAPGQGSIRLYVTDLSDIPGHGADNFSIVFNAEWTGTAWVYDSSSFRSLRFDFAKHGVFMLVKEALGTSPWVDADWADGTEAFEYFSAKRGDVGRGEVTVLGQLILNSLLTQAGAEVPKIKGNIVDDITNSYTLIAEFESETSGRWKTRIYSFTSGSSVSFSITLNARWDDSANLWELDETGDSAFMLSFAMVSSSGTLYCYGHDEGDGSTWLNWDTFGSLSSFITSELGRFRLTDGYLEFTDVTAGGSNPDWDKVTTNPNSLYAANVVKAWAHVTVTGGAGSRVVTVDDGFGWNVSGITLNGSGRIELDFNNALDIGYAAVLTDSGAQPEYVWTNTSMTTGVLTIAAVDMNTPLVFVDIDSLGVDFKVSVIVCGKQS